MNQSEKLKKKRILIYLADLVHNYVGRGPFMFPINIGYIKVYLLKFRNDLDIKLFKYPDNLIQEIENNPPEILGLSNYVWNEDLNTKLLSYIKFKFPNIITVMGGPNINYRDNLLFNYLKKQKDLDFYIIHKGEFGFVNLINNYIDSNYNISSMKELSIEGVAFFDKEKNQVIRGQDTPFLQNLDIIPSPYLSGVMDEFFYDTLIPNVETNRGCPYKCTFCVWGRLDYNKVGVFSLDRVNSELEYISNMVNKIKKTNILCISDSNFGIFDERDYEFAKLIKKLSDEHGYPRKVTTFWAKNKGNKLKKFVDMLGDLVSVDASLQSMNPETLKAIKRDNINQQEYKDLLKFCNEKGIDSDAELIIGMPYETKETHIEALRELFDMRAGQIIVYNCRILQGSEMALPEEIEKYDIKTKFRLIDTQFGEYNGFKSFEVEEMVKSTNTMSEEDILYFRPLHWLIQFMWNYKYYRGLLEYILSYNINPVDFLIYLLKNIKNAPPKVQKLMREFDFDSRTEWFSTREELIKHYSKSEVFEDIKNGGFGKLNYKYTFKVLLEGPIEFDKYMAQIAEELILQKIHNINYKQAINNIIKFESMLRINFYGFDLNKKFVFESEKFETFDYDLINWRKDSYKKSLYSYALSKPVTYKFYLPQDQIDALYNNINQFKNINPNFTLRKMSEYMRISDLFYKVESKENKKYTVQIENQDFNTSKFVQ